MLNTDKKFLSQVSWVALWTRLMFFLVVLGFNVLDDVLSDVFDPREQ